MRRTHSWLQLKSLHTATPMVLVVTSVMPKEGKRRPKSSGSAAR